jgi:hypothetical protein
MPWYKAIRPSVILTIMVIFYLLLGGCAAASTTPDPALPERAPVSIEIEGETPTTIAPAAENQASATARPTTNLAESQAPNVLELILHEQGFGQAGSQLAYGFEIENPNTVAVSDNVFQILAYDESGVLVGSEVENLPLLLPGQLLGIAGSLQLDSEQIINELLLQITAGDTLELDVLPKLEVVGVNYQPSEIYNRVSGLIGNEGDLELEDIRISAIAYSSDGRIVGAGYTFLSFLPAGTTAGVDIVLTTNEPVDRVELYPRVSLPTLLQTSFQRPPFTSELAILDYGFSQEGIEIGYGFLVANPNLSHALEDTEYRITFFNDKDDVIAVDEGYIDLLIPGQIFGIGDHIFVDEGENVDRMAILARPSTYKPAIPKPGLAAENVTLITGTVGIIVSGEIINPYQTMLENVRVTAVIYDNAGRIVGGGYDWIDSIAPAGLVPVEVWVIAPREPAAAELYASIAQIIRE